MVRFESDGTFARFRSSPALFRRFDPMIDGVPEQVREWSFNFLKNVAIHLSVLTADFQPELLFERASEIAHHPRESLNPIRKGTHSAGQHLAVKTVRKIGRIT